MENSQKRKKYRRNRKQFFETNYIEYSVKLNISKCQIRDCRTILRGFNSSNIKRHYQTIHNMFIIINEINLESLIANEDEQNLYLKKYYDYDRLYNKSICKTLNCITIINGNNVNDLLAHYNQEHNIKIQPPENFNKNDIVLEAFGDDYDDVNKTYRCLFKNCNIIKVNNVEDVKRHYLDNHKILYSLDKAFSNKFNYLNKIQHSSEIVKKNVQCVKQKRRKTNVFNFEEYLELFPGSNVSRCLLENCKKILKLHASSNIKRHYKFLHHMTITQGIRNGRMVERYLAQDYNKLSLSSLKQFLFYQYETKSYKCLFKTCSQIMDQDSFDVIRTHYRDCHKVVIGTYVSNKHKNITKDDDSSSTESEEETGNSDSEEYNEENSSSNSPELLNDHDNNFEKDNESQMSNPLTNEIDETPLDFKDLEITINANSKNLQENPYILEIANEIHLTKSKFLKLCLGLLINYDLPMKIFNDKEYFKPLLAPYEEQIDSDVNAQEMENLLQKANHVIVEELKNIFKNKIICLELYLIRYELKNYVIFNIRFWAEDKIHNKIIGFLPITETFTTLPISDYLNQFHIEEKQIYMKTILAINSEHNEIYKIYENLCKHNPDLKKHPIQELQIILRNFKQKYSKEIKFWQEITNYKENLDLDVWKDLNDFAKHVKDKSETDIDLKTKLQNAKDFFKTLEIFWNFVEKLSNEQYVAGDLYRDMLRCELELKEVATKYQNLYAEYLSEQLIDFQNNLWETQEFMGALYLDIRFNFFGTRFLNDQQKLKAKLFLANLWERFKTFLNSWYNNNDPLLNNTKGNNAHDDDDEYALLDKHLNVSTNLTIHDKLTMWIPARREPFSFNILQFNNPNIGDINALSKLAFLYPVTQFLLQDLSKNFMIFTNDSNKFDKFIMKCNQDILELKEDLFF
ncbi:uncharacterized protein ACRADG_001745 [Cochliomyia hominivorax]